jgi:hypothetical protein
MNVQSADASNTIGTPINTDVIDTESTAEVLAGVKGEHVYFFMFMSQLTAWRVCPRTIQQLSKTTGRLPTATTTTISTATTTISTAATTT